MRAADRYKMNCPCTERMRKACQAFRRIVRITARGTINARKRRAEKRRMDRALLK